MQAYGKNIIVKPFKASDFSEGGLLIPDSAKRPSNKVLVTSVGHKVTKVREQETVFRVKDWGQEVLINNELHFIMDENAILASE